MKTIISMLAALLCCVMIYAQDEAITVETHVEQYDVSESDCIVPNDAITIQLSDIQSIEENGEYSTPELDENFEEMQFKLSDEPALYMIYEGECAGTFPVTEQDTDSITVSINDEDSGGELLYQMTFTPE